MRISLYDSHHQSRSYDKLTNIASGLCLFWATATKIRSARSFDLDIASNYSEIDNLLPGQNKTHLTPHGSSETLNSLLSPTSDSTDFEDFQEGREGKIGKNPKVGKVSKTSKNSENTQHHTTGKTTKKVHLAKAGKTAKELQGPQGKKAQKSNKSESKSSQGKEQTSSNSINGLKKKNDRKPDPNSSTGLKKRKEAKESKSSPKSLTFPKSKDSKEKTTKVTYSKDAKKAKTFKSLKNPGGKSSKDSKGSKGAKISKGKDSKKSKGSKYTAIVENLCDIEIEQGLRIFDKLRDDLVPFLDIVTGDFLAFLTDFLLTASDLRKTIASELNCDKNARRLLKTNRNESAAREEVMEIIGTFLEEIKIFFLTLTLFVTIDIGVIEAFFDYLETIFVVYFFPPTSMPSTTSPSSSNSPNYARRLETPTSSKYLKTNDQKRVNSFGIPEKLLF